MKSLALLVALTPALARADGFESLMRSICGDESTCAQAIYEAQRAEQGIPPAVVPRTIKTHLALDEDRHFRALAAYVCRERKALLNSGTSQFAVQGGSRGGDGCPSAPIRLFSTSPMLGGNRFSFEIGPQGAVKAYSTLIVQNPAVGAVIPQDVPAAIDRVDVQEALERAVAVWTAYPVPSR